MRRILGLSFALLVLPAGAAFAASDDPSVPSTDDIQAIHDCLEASEGNAERQIAIDCIGIVANPCLDTPDGQTTPGMSACVLREEAIWDGLLNDWYGMAREGMSRELKDQLRDVQRKWIDWRDAKCGFEHAKFEGGTAGGPAAAACLMETTAARALELRSLVLEFGEQ